MISRKETVGHVTTKTSAQRRRLHSSIDRSWIGNIYLSKEEHTLCEQLLRSIYGRKGSKLVRKHHDIVQKYLQSELLASKPIGRIAKNLGRSRYLVKKLIRELAADVIDIAPTATMDEVLQVLRMINLKTHRLTLRSLKKIDESLGWLQVEKRMSCRAIGKAIGRGEGKVRILLKKTRGTTRVFIRPGNESSEEQALRILSTMTPRCRVPTPESQKILQEGLNKLYVDQKVSILDLARRTDRSPAFVRKILEICGIPIRDQSSAVVLRQLRYRRREFNENPMQKAYLVGLAMGDIYVERPRRSIWASTATTHPAMIRLFKETFQSYGHVRQYPRFIKKSKSFVWHIRVGLEPSFDFMQTARETAIGEVTYRPSLFPTVLAAMIDSDGDISIRNSHGTARITLRLRTMDKKTLQWVRKELMRRGYHPTLRLERRKGSETPYGKYSKDYWSLSVGRKREAARLLHELPLRHREKIARKKLALKAVNSNLRWDDVKGQVEALRDNILRQVSHCVSRSKVEWKKRRSTGPSLD